MPAPTSAITDRFHRQFHDAGERALAATGVVSHRLVVATCPIRLDFAGPVLADLFMPALAHHVVPDHHGATASITVWDGVSSDVTAPMPPPGVTFTPRGDIAGLDGDDHLSAFQYGENSVAVFDRRTRAGCYWVPDANDLAYWARSSPLRSMFGWILRDHGVHLVHGAAVGRAGRAVLLVGPGGSGKSTTAVRAAAAGMDFVGDDYVAVSVNPPKVHHVYATAKLDPAVQIDAFSRTHTPGDEKAVLPLPTSVIQSTMNLAGIATLRITGHPESSLEATTPDALRAAALYTTLEQIPHPKGLEEAVDNLIAALPGGQLAIGTDADDLMSVLSEAIARPTSLRLRSADVHPTLSVIIPVHNGASFLADAVDSVRRQQFDIEVVVVDDGSTDDFDTVIATLPVDVVVRQAQRGPAAARNAGIAASSAEIITFLDVDDLWPAGRTRALLHEVTDGHAQVAIGLSQVYRYTDPGGWQEFGTPETSFPWSVGGAMFRRTIFDEVGGFDEEMRYAEDTDWFARLKLTAAQLNRIPVTTLCVRRHGANMTEGRDPLELNVIRAVKKALDRQRARDEQ